MVLDVLREFDNDRPRRSLSVEKRDVVICGYTVDNHFILTVSAFSFAIFVTAEIIGALASGSLSLLGDAGAMSVDVFTYFCNMYSEHVKRKYGRLDDTTRFVLEVGIPSFSVLALLGVTTWITYDAIVVIRNPEDESVNVMFLFGFASANALVDIICTILFYLRRRDVLLNNSQSTTRILDSSSDSPQFAKSEDNKRSVNLNMASALTHVSGDTLRTTSVFVAALVATFSSYSGALCDAWAAIVVTVTILFIVFPLVNEIYQHAKTHPFFSSSSSSSSSTTTGDHSI